MRDLSTDPAFAPFVERGSIKEPSIVCQYGCGRRYVVQSTTRLKGHPSCLVELGQDLWALAQRFPALALSRLARDLGLSLHTLESILRPARAVVADERLAPVLQVPEFRRRPLPMTNRDRAALLAIIEHRRAYRGAMPTYHEVADALAISGSNAAIRLLILRRKGWITFLDVMHAPACEQGCRRSTCPLMMRERDAARYRRRKAAAA